MIDSTRATLFIADDHPVFLEGLSRILEKEYDRFSIVGSATNGKEALDKILEIHPDIALLDISMPELTGICIARELLKRKIRTKVILLTAHDNQQYLDEALKLGVCGYVLKENTKQELLDALLYVQKGNTYISPLLSARILKNETAEITPDLNSLTAREKEILTLVAEYKTSEQIALILDCSPKTVENHRANICTKLRLRGHNALLEFAIRQSKDVEAYHQGKKSF